MPAFYSPTRGECFTHYPRGILDGTDDEYEFDDESVAPSKIVDLMKPPPAGSKHFHHDSDSDFDDDSDGFPNDQDDDEDVDTVVPDETEIVAKRKNKMAVPVPISVVVTKKKETPFELLKRLEEEESDDEEFNKMLETPIFAKVAKKPNAEWKSEKENMSPDPIKVKSEIDDEDMDKKPAAKTKEQLEAETKRKEEKIDNDLIDLHLQKLLDDHLGEVRHPFKMIDLKSDLKWKTKDNKVKKEAKKRKKKKNRQAASKKVDEPPIKQRKLTYQEKQDEAYAYSLHIQELLQMTRGKKI